MVGIKIKGTSVYHINHCLLCGQGNYYAWSRVQLSGLQVSWLSRRRQQISWDVTV